jgi:hypothetical protein
MTGSQPSSCPLCGRIQEGAHKPTLQQRIFTSLQELDVKCRDLTRALETIAELAGNESDVLPQISRTASDALGRWRTRRES